MASETSTGAKKVSTGVDGLPTGADNNFNPRAYYKFWVMTINNYTDEDEQTFSKFAPEKTVYAVYGREEGDNKTPHMQCFFGLKEKTRHATLRKIFPRAWLAPATGTAVTAANYCMKEGSFWEYGNLSALAVIKGRNSRMKSDYNEIWNKAVKRKFNEIDRGVMIRHYTTIKRISQDYQEKAKDAPFLTGYWFHGPPRTGKSATARQENPIYFDKMCNKWWDGYQGEEVVLIDDFDKNHKVLGHHMKRWMDRYSFGAEQKGTSVQIRPLRVIVTSNYTPEEIWEDDPVLAAAIRERCIFRFFPKCQFNAATGKFGGEYFKYRPTEPIAIPEETEIDNGFVTPDPTTEPKVCPGAPERPVIGFGLSDAQNMDEVLEAMRASYEEDL